MSDENQQTPPPSDSSDVPVVGRRRIALLGGACGTAKRVRITGQILDVPVLQSHLNEPWSRTAMLPQSLVRRFRAVQDAGINPVRGPRLRIEVLHADTEHPESDAPFTVWDDIHAKGGTSFSIDAVDFPPLPPGEYLLRISLLAVESIRQHMTDLAYLGTGSSQYSQKDTVVGFGKLRVLADDFDGPVIMSDIDQTFLDTKIDSRQGLMDALFERIESKRPLPGMEQFYRDLRKEGIPLFFVSASPSFFRRTLEGVFDRFQIGHDGLFLKNLLGPINNIVRKTFEVLSNIEEYMTQNMSDAMERSAKFLGSTMQSMVDQIAYKLTVLLEQRTMMPAQASEILIGDNTESDYFIFTIYQHLLLGAIPPDQIEDFFYHLNFHDREAITRDSARRIATLTEKNLTVHGPLNPVQAVWIHQARPETGTNEMLASITEAVAEIRPRIEAGEIRPPVAYSNAFELALLALNDSLFDAGSVLRVAQACLGQVLRDEQLDRPTLLAVVDRFPFKKQVHREQIKKAVSEL